MSSPRAVAQITGPWLAPILVRAGRLPDGADIGVGLEVIGADRGFTGTIVRATWRGGGSSGAVIVKLPDAAGPAFERCAREVRFYGELAADTGAAVPAVLAAEADPEREAVVLVMDPVDGREGDPERGATADEVSAVVSAMAGMHARWWRSPQLAELDWLPHWGQGTAGRPDPHRRAAERFRRRIGPFLEWYGEPASAAFRDVVERVGRDCEAIYAALAAQPATLMHADLHLDNLMFADDPSGPRSTIIDWQSVSRGPGAYDLVMFLASALRGPAAQATLPRAVEQYAAALRAAGIPLADVAGVGDAVRLSLLRLLAGFVSGYGGRPPDTLTPREVRMILASVSDEGLGGLAIRYGERG